jgi:A/G-specific adenine glycosylase
MEMSNICNPLIAWFAANKRPLPWRDNPTPYAVWVSEVMAQQTRMAQLLPFYTRFMERFPTVDDLDTSDLDEVLSAWAGMGYYARARNLHQTAKTIRERYGDGWPQTRKEWESLPGVGPYTAGAVLSIAFGQPEPAIDGNVLRLVARLTDDDTDINTPIAKKRAFDWVKSLYPKSSTDNTVNIAGVLTQALMELGSLVCTPANPRCDICPVADECRARQNGRERELPIKSRKKASPIIPMLVLLIFSADGRILMRRRTEGLLKGMWVYYLTEGTPTDIPAHASEMGYTVKSTDPLGEFTHTFTHRIWEMTGYALTVYENHTVDDYVFLTPDEVEKIAIPAAMKYFKR